MNSLQLIQGPSVWRSDTFANEEEFTLRLAAHELDRLDQMVQAPAIGGRELQGHHLGRY
jgi:hypothetical protein